MSPPLVLLIIAVYFALLFTVSYIAGRRADNAGFFVGNRRSPWYVVAFAMIGSSISGVTFVSVPGMVAASGFGYMQMVLGFVAGQLVIAFVLTPLFYRMQLVSIYEYLEKRFGLASYRTGAWFFFVSKMLGAAVRLFVVCITLQLLVFEPLGLPFALNAVATVALVWLYTFRGGVKSLIWTDSLKTFCLVASVGLCIYYMASRLQFSFGDMIGSIFGDERSRIFFFDDINNRQYFFKQFLAGVFTMIATNGLDQDMMQRNLSCRNSRDSQKNLLTSVFFQVVINLLFLMLGVLLYQFAARQGITVAKSDELFPQIAVQSGYFPPVVAVLFIVGLISAAYAAAGSALTALTTSFTVDILGTRGKSEAQVVKLRKRVHVGMAIGMGITIYVFNELNNTSVIDAVYRLASYTYGPILGLFAFGIGMKQPVRDRFIPLVAILSPILCLVLDTHSEAWFGGYRFSYELLIMNAAFTFGGLCLLIKRNRQP
ncbi:MAG: sodium:solute symporter [Prevotellaceae bacterium]|nr:sodium:solute symporter [Prevotellaceae bacterium]